MADEQMTDQELDQEVELTEVEQSILNFVMSINRSQIGLVSMRLVGTGEESEREKIQLQFCQYITDPNRPIRAAGAFNKADPRFNVSGPRRAWLSVEKEDLQDALPSLLAKHKIEVGEITEEEIFIGEINVRVEKGVYAGALFAIEITEVQHPAPGERQSEYERDNLMDAAKQTGNGFYCVAEKQGVMKPIFSREEVVLSKPNHTFIPYTLISKEEFELLEEEDFGYTDYADSPSSEAIADTGSEITHEKE